MSENKKRTKSNMKKKKSMKKKSVTSLNKKESKDSVDIVQLCKDFDQIIVNEKKETEDKDLFEFARKNLFYKEGETKKLDSKGFIVFLFKISGLTLNLEDEDEFKKYDSLTDTNCTDLDIIKELMQNCGGKLKNIKNTKLTKASNSVIEYIYNSFDILRQDDFLNLKGLIIKLLKLSDCQYRLIRNTVAQIICKLLTLLFAEIKSTETIIEKNKENKNNDSNSKTETSAITLLKNKVQIIKELIYVIEEKFILLRNDDVSQVVRTVIADTISTISVDNFNLFFSSPNMIKNFNYFILDPNIQIRNKYLNILYEQLQNLSLNEDKKKSDILSQILSCTKESILDICIGGDINSSKQAIKIIELLPGILFFINPKLIVEAPNNNNNNNVQNVNPILNQQENNN